VQYWEDLSVGQEFHTRTITIDAAEIITFAEQFDPQPYHLDPVVAAESIFGGLCASGWQVCALMMRLLTDTMTAEHIRSEGSPGVESLRWLKPVFANDTLHALIKITHRRAAESQHPFGLITCAIDVKNQQDKSVIVLNTDILIEMRPVPSNSLEASNEDENNG